MNAASSSVNRIPRLRHPLKLIFIASVHPDRPSLVDAWRRAITRYLPAQADGPVQVSVHEGRLQEIEPADIQHDCIVSPANSFGIMDGGFDLELSRVFQGASADMYALTDHVQAHLRARWAGYAPPGSCTLVPLPAEVSGAGRNAWGTHTVAVVPTMTKPENVGWQRELVYHATWTLLCTVARWNEDAEPDRPGTSGGAHEGAKRDGDGKRRISGVLMTGLGTGAGGVSTERCARQMVLAVKHWSEGPLGERVRWETVERRVGELQETRDL